MHYKFNYFFFFTRYWGCTNINIQNCILWNLLTKGNTTAILKPVEMEIDVFNHVAVQKSLAN